MKKTKQPQYKRHEAAMHADEAQDAIEMERLAARYDAARTKRREWEGLWQEC